MILFYKKWLREKWLREKWLWALCLAILVHVGFFFVFYLNVHKEKPVQVTNNASNSPKSSAATRTDDHDSLLTITADMGTPNSADSIDETRPDSQNNLSTTKLAADKESIADSNTNQTLTAQTLTEQSASVATKPTLTSKQRAQTIETLTPQTADTSVARFSGARSSGATSSSATPSKNTEMLENIKAQAGLLSIDVPTQQPDVNNIKTDTEYLSAKSEVEDINSQLSAAINEVKNRNQQKIDEMQQQRHRPNRKDSQEVTVMSEPATQKD
ncbi:hypothetical protein AAJP47_06615 [Psychrobacter sp. B38]|uniref:hypothetical protein n=1 Tax=Psychrobacter sp. B38 TaxID=3143538 RepID=UPI00320CF6CC